MTRSQLIVHIADETGVNARLVENVLDSLCDSVAQQLKIGEKVTIAGFGRFEMRQRQSKSFINPKTGEASTLQPTSLPSFKASGTFKKKLRG